MSQVATISHRLPAMTKRECNKVKKLVEATRHLPQIEIETHHTLHGGLYSRTVMIPAGVVMAGAMVKIPTTLILNGHVTVFVGGRSVEIHGHHVFAGDAGRQQAVYAHSDTWATMCFPTNAATVQEAEREFTDEYAMLMSNSNVNTHLITGG